MKVALTIWNHRVAPVFDGAKWWVFTDSEKSETLHQFVGATPQEKLEELLSSKVDVLLCGAIPFCYEKELIDAGCQVYSFLAGPWEMIMDAYWKGDIENSRFKMPGCCHRRRRCGKGHF